MMSLTFGLFTQVSGSGPLGPLVYQRYLHKMFKIETSDLIYKFTTTSCIMGLKMGLFLFVLPCICSFFSLSRFFVKDISTTV